MLGGTNTTTMTTSTSSQPIYSSPKRKRDAIESYQYSPSISPSISRLNTGLREYPFVTSVGQPQGQGDVGDGSPRSAVAGQLQNLDLQGDFIRRLDFSDPANERVRKRFAQMDSEESASRELPSRPANDFGASSISREAETEENSDTSKTWGEIGTDGITQRLSTPPSSNLSDLSASPILDKPRARNKSPPLAANSDEDPLTWHDSEITGHNPTDPNDDGYGINGIGFRPTPAIAWARSRKRKQQVAEWKTREAREARQRRSERRRGGSSEGSSGSGSWVEKKVRVRFEEGGKL